MIFPLSNKIIFARDLYDLGGCEVVSLSFKFGFKRIQGQKMLFTPLEAISPLIIVPFPKLIDGTGLGKSGS